MIGTRVPFSLSMLVPNSSFILWFSCILRITQEFERWWNCWYCSCWWYWWVLDISNLSPNTELLSTEIVCSGNLFVWLSKLLQCWSLVWVKSFSCFLFFFLWIDDRQEPSNVICDFIQSSKPSNTLEGWTPHVWNIKSIICDGVSLWSYCVFYCHSKNPPWILY